MFKAVITKRMLTTIATHVQPEQMIQVVVPEGMCRGQKILEETPSGVLEVDIPRGLKAGQAFESLDSPAAPHAGTMPMIPQLGFQQVPVPMGESQIFESESHHSQRNRIAYSVCASLVTNCSHTNYVCQCAGQSPMQQMQQQMPMQLPMQQQQPPQNAVGSATESSAILQEATTGQPPLISTPTSRSQPANAGPASGLLYTTQDGVQVNKTMSTRFLRMPRQA